MGLGDDKDLSPKLTKHPKILFRLPKAPGHFTLRQNHSLPLSMAATMSPSTIPTKFGAKSASRSSVLKPDPTKRVEVEDGEEDERDEDEFEELHFHSLC